MDETYFKVLQDLQSAMRKAVKPFVNYYVNAFGKSDDEAWDIARHISLEEISMEMACCCAAMKSDYARDQRITEAIYGEPDDEEFWEALVVDEDIY